MGVSWYMRKRFDRAEQEPVEIDGGTYCLVR